MKKGIHPEIHDVTLTCTCGATYQIDTTVADLSSTTLCSACHPFFSGEQKFVDTAGRIERFQERYKKYNNK